MRKRLALCAPGVFEQCAARGDRRLQVLDAEAGERGRAELREQPFAP